MASHDYAKPSHSDVSVSPPAGLVYIHVGKCGGTFIGSWLHKARVKFAELHMVRPSVDDRQYSRYVVWVRDPVERFRSAYDFERAVILTNTTGMTSKNVHQRCERVSAECLAPARVVNKVFTGHAFPEDYEKLILHFDDANEVAEALSTCSSTSAKERENCELAWKLMYHPAEHINKGVGWYLYDGAFVEKHADRMFVGTQENMAEDLERLGRWLNVTTIPSPPPVRVSPPSNRNLSDAAQANIRAYYNQSGLVFRDSSAYVSADYETMRSLVRAGLLRADQYDLRW